MPLIKYQCVNPECGKDFSKFFKSKVLDNIVCPKCAFQAKRLLGVPSSESKITIDNGLQPRATEINPNIMEMREERSNKKPDRGI